MVLSKLLEGVPVIKMFQTLYGRMVMTHEVEVSGIQYDSRYVQRGEMFVAIRGSTTDGHAFIGMAISRGAAVVVVEDDNALPDSYFMHAGVVKIVVGDSRVAMAVIASNFYNRPSRRLRLVGVTGTNGKTTTTHLIKSVLEKTGEKVGLIGTINYTIGTETVAATHTTPESVELNRLLTRMVAQDCTAAVMEVSSHALSQKRVHGLEFSAATFTNLTQDHLDFHGSFEEYFKAKKILFDQLSPDATAITNVNDDRGMDIVRDSRARMLSYGLSDAADIRAADITLTVNGTNCVIMYSGARHRVTSPLIGRFNVFNLMAAFATGVALGVPGAAIAQGLAGAAPVRGRFERIQSPFGWTAIVDYAHTPDALENCLRAIREVLPPDRSGRIITVFGCGGNRDRGKRPIMGRIASSLSDITIVTSDNPRNETPGTIIEEIVAGVDPRSNVVAEVDRRAAIHRALNSAVAGDVVLIAGKGHETYQVIGEKKQHFDDREEVENFIRGAV